MTEVSHRRDPSNTTLRANIWVPEGLLRSLSNGAQGCAARRHQADQCPSTIEQVLQQPARAILEERKAYTTDVSDAIFKRSTLSNQTNSPPPKRRASGAPSYTWIPPQRELCPQVQELAPARTRSAHNANIQRSSVRFVQRPRSENVTDKVTADDDDESLITLKPKTVSEQYVNFSLPNKTPTGVFAQAGSTIQNPNSNRKTQSIRRSVALVPTIVTEAGHAVSETIGGLFSRPHRSSLHYTYERAKVRHKQLQRSKAMQILFQYTFYIVIMLFIYLVLVGQPLWPGAVWYTYLLFQSYAGFVGGTSAFLGLSFFYAFGPLLILFEKPAAMPAQSLGMDVDDDNKATSMPFPSRSNVTPTTPIHENLTAPKDVEKQDSSANAGNDTALLIPCYRSAKLLPATITAALKIFPATSIFILANGNSETPLDDTEMVCKEFNVHHVWIPVGSKIVAQYVGAYMARSFPYVLLIDDDCILPSNFPIVTDRLDQSTRCLGYTITSIGANRGRGTWCQQAQDLEYKLSGLQRQFAGKLGSATFPHGAIVLWQTDFLIRTFREHPGFSVSEDWFFGHVARVLGSRITMCSSVFVETETPDSLFFAFKGGMRGGFGEMTVFKQRFKRWNFFFVNGCYYNLVYILLSWKLGWRELGAKLFVLQEVYETLLYLITPFTLPISFILRPTVTIYLLVTTIMVYLINVVIFNEVHLRLASRGSRKNMMVDRRMLLIYYIPFKFALTLVSVASCYWSIWQYAEYFAKRHPKIVEDERAVGVVLKLEESKGNVITATSEKQKEGILQRHAMLDDEVTQNTKHKRELSHDQTNTPSTRPYKSHTYVRSIGRLEQESRSVHVTAVKVDVVSGIGETPQLTMGFSDRGEPLKFMIEPVDGKPEPNHTRTRSRSLSGGVMGPSSDCALSNIIYTDQKGFHKRHKSHLGDVLEEPDACSDCSSNWDNESICAYDGVMHSTTAAPHHSNENCDRNAHLYRSGDFSHYATLVI